MSQEDGRQSNSYSRKKEYKVTGDKGQHIGKAGWNPEGDVSIALRGGAHIKAAGRNGMLYDISEVDTQRLDIDLESHKVSSH